MKLWSSPLITALTATAFLLGSCETGEERAERHFRSGVELVERGDVDRGLVELRNVFNLDSGHREARRLYARLMRERGEDRQAYGHYLRLVEAYPDDVEGRLALAEMAAMMGNWSEVERHIEIPRDARPDDPLVRSIVGALDYRRALQAEDPEARTEALVQARETLSQDTGQIISRRVVINELLASDNPLDALSEVELAIEQEPDNLEYHELRFRLLLLAEDAAAATAQLEDMYTRFPENAQVRETLIQWYMHQGDLAAAERFLRELAQDAESIDASLTLVQFLRVTQGIEAARNELERLVATGSHEMRYRTALAVLDVEAGRVGEGTAALEALVEDAAPGDVLNDSRVILSRIYEAQGNMVGARAQIEQVLASDPSNVNALKAQARWHIQADRYGDAMNTLRRALDQAPRDPELLTMMAQVHDLQGERELMGDRLALAMESAQMAPAETLRYARFLIQAERLTTARAALNDALRRNPQNVELLIALGEVYIRLEEWERASAVEAQLIENGSEEARTAAHSLRNALLSAQGRGDEAIAFIDDLITRGEAGTRAVALVIQGHLRAGRIDEAEDYIDSQLETDPQSPDLRLLRAGLHGVRGDFDAAKAVLAALVEEYPQAEAPVRGLYQLHRQLGETEAAGEVLTAALEQMPDSLTLNWMRAAELENAEDFEGAIEVYERMYERHRDNLIIANNLASLISTHRDDAESLERAATIAMRLRGREVPQFQDTYGWIAYRRGQYEEALSYLESAAVGLPDNALVQYHLGMTYVALERIEDARAVLERALELAGDSALPQFDVARQTLQELSENGG